MKLLLVSDGLAALSLFSVGLYGLGVWEGGLPHAAACTVAQAANGLGVPINTGSYTHINAPETRGRVVSFTRMLHVLSGLVILLAIVGLLESVPHASALVFTLSGVFVLLAALIYARMPQVADMRTNRRDWRGLLAVLVRDKHFRRFQLFQFVLGFANLGAVPLLAVYVKEELQLPVDLAVLVVSGGALEQAAILLTVRFHGSLFDRIGVVWHRALASALIGAGFLLWALADSLWWGVAAALAIGLGRAGGGVVWTIGSLYFAPGGDEGLYAGVHTSLTGIRGIIAPLAGLWFFEAVCNGAYRPMFYTAAGLVFASAIGHALLVRVPEREEVPTG
jgi:hypothetical protein